MFGGASFRAQPSTVPCLSMEWTSTQHWEVMRVKGSGVNDWHSVCFYDSYKILSFPLSFFLLFCPTSPAKRLLPTLLEDADSC